jgi:hypothetical protein
MSHVLVFNRESYKKKNPTRPTSQLDSISQESLGIPFPSYVICIQLFQPGTFYAREKLNFLPNPRF